MRNCWGRHLGYRWNASGIVLCTAPVLQGHDCPSMVLDAFHCSDRSPLLRCANSALIDVFPFSGMSFESQTSRAGVQPCAIGVVQLVSGWSNKPNNEIPLHCSSHRPFNLLFCMLYPAACLANPVLGLLHIPLFAGRPSDVTAHVGSCAETEW